MGQLNIPEEPQTEANPSPKQQHSVFVGNLPASYDQAKITDFFSFCGTISKLYITEQGNTKSAIIEFETTQACETAQLLNQATVGDLVIAVGPYVPDQAGSTPAPPMENPKPTTASLSEPEKTAVAVISRIIAEGYILGKEAEQQARILDAKYQISETVSKRVNDASTKATKLAETYHLRESLQSVGQAVTNAWTETNQNYVSPAIHTVDQAVVQPVGQKVHQVDATFKISEQATKTAQSAGEKINQVKAKIAQDPHVQTAESSVNKIVEATRDFSTKVIQSTSEFIEVIGAEVDKQVQERTAPKALTAIVPPAEDPVDTDGFEKLDVSDIVTK